MECDFQVGDKVVCIEEIGVQAQRQYGVRGPILDEIYHVRYIRPGKCACGDTHIYVHLREIVVPNRGFGEPGFASMYFRKLLTIDDFKSVDTTAPVDRIKEPETC